jgi:hypothetical protein
MTKMCLGSLLLLALCHPAPGQELSAEEKAAGFVAMFNGKDLSGWEYIGKPPSTFTVEDGAIHYKGGSGWLCYTGKEYPDFELRCDFQLIKKGGDGGIFFRAVKNTGGTGWPSPRYELQVKDYDEQARFWGVQYKLDKEKVAKVRKGLGEWQTYRLVVKGDKAEAYLNGEPVSTAEGLKPGKQAFIGLQAEGGEQAFRNLRVRPLESR